MSSCTSYQSEDEYNNYLTKLNKVLTGSFEVLYTTDVDSTALWNAYLQSFQPQERQTYNCSSCRRFIRRYGGLVRIDQNGKTSSLWDENIAPDLLKPSVKNMRKLVEKANVNGVFLTSKSVWGEPITNGWTHLHINPNSKYVYKNSVMNAGQAMAEKCQDYKNVSHAISEFSKDVVQQAVTLLKSESLYRNEKVFGPAQFLLDLHNNIEQGHNKKNIIWKAVGNAPAGFCHPRASMIGTLLEDIAAGLPFNIVAKKFENKMHPLKYQRPQAAPKLNTIKQAEELVEKMGIEKSLERRFARIEDLQTIWMPKELKKNEKKGGVFSDLISSAKSKQDKVGAQDVNPLVMTWEKFNRTVLPDALKIELYTYSTTNSYAAFVTATNQDSPPILQWDTEEKRNPVSWYLYCGGSHPEKWDLVPNTYVPITAVALKPNMWNSSERYKHHGDGVMFCLEGAKDTASTGLMLFPEILKSELHSVRSVIEAFSRKSRLTGVEETNACGLLFLKSTNKSGKVKLRVTTSVSVLIYELDRWD